MRKHMMLAGLTGTLIIASQIAAAEPAASEDQLQEIVVTGIRASLGRALDMKRDAATILDSISAEELGKFPSRNVADALINIPGITVERTAGGEGQRITIRGLGGDFNITTLNGRTLTTEDTGREFTFDVLPSEMIAGSDVYKAVQAQNLEGSLGGSVDLRSARPFDFEGLHVAGSIEGEYGDLPKKWGKRVSGVISDTFDDDRMGALLVVSYSKRDTRTDNLHEISATSGTEQDWNTDFNNNGTVDDDGVPYYFPQFYSTGTILSQHERLGLSGAFQFRPNDRLLLTIDALHTRYDASQQNYASSNYITPREDQEPATLADPDALKWVPGTVRADANGVITNFTTSKLVAEVLDDTTERIVKTNLFGGNLKWDATDSLQVVGDTYFSQSKRDSGGKNRFVVAGITGATAEFATRDNGLPDLAITIPGNRTLSQGTNDDFRAHYIGIGGDNLSDRIFGAKLDLKLTLDSGFARAVKFGVSYSDRSKSSDVIDNNATSCLFCGYPFTFGQIGANVIQPPAVTNLLSELPGNFPRTFATFNIDNYLNSLALAEQNPNVLAFCPKPDLNCAPDEFTQYPAGYSTQVLSANLPASFKVKEKTIAAYLQGEFSGDRWRADVGLRLVNTKVTSTGHSVELAPGLQKIPGQTADYIVNLTDPVAVSGGGSYTKALPAANFAYDLRRDLRLRLAAAKVLSRPSLFQLSTSTDWSNWSSGSFITYHAGNPDLKPTEANQFDASLEWYLSPRSYVAAAVFYKSVKNFVQPFVPVLKTYTDPETGVSVTYDDVQVLNGDSGKVRGAEIGGQYLFDNGFGVVANLTTTTSSSKVNGVSGKLPGVIPHSYNLKLLYEKHGWSNQVSYSYASQFTYSLDSPYIPGLPIVSDAYKDLSATISYEFPHRITVFVEASNLLKNADARFSTFRNLPAYYESWGRAYFVGLRARL